MWLSGVWGQVWRWQLSHHHSLCHSESQSALFLSLPGMKQKLYMSWSSSGHLSPHPHLGSPSHPRWIDQRGWDSLLHSCSWAGWRGAAAAQPEIVLVGLSGTPRRWVPSLWCFHVLLLFSPALEEKKYTQSSALSRFFCLSQLGRTADFTWDLI